jgi:hypothetical protein
MRSPLVPTPLYSLCTHPSSPPLYILYALTPRPHPSIFSMHSPIHCVNLHLLPCNFVSLAFNSSAIVHLQLLVQAITMQAMLFVTLMAALMLKFDQGFK